MAIFVTTQIGPLLQVTASVEDTTTAGSTIGSVMIVSAHSVFAERFVRIDGDANTVVDALVAMGFSPFSDEVGAARAVFRYARVPVSHIIMGRRTPGDPTWAVALTAIKAALDLAKVVVLHVLAVTRVETQQREIAAFCNVANATGPGWVYTMQTPSDAVRTNALGSLEKLIQADGSMCNILYYDPAGESDAATPVVSTVAETFALAGDDESALTVSLSMSVQQDGDTPEETTFEAGKAVVTGTNAGPFDLEPGDKFDTGADGLGPFAVTIAAVAAVLDSGNPGPYVLADGMPVEWIVNGTSYTYNVAAANYGGNPAAATSTQIATEAMLLAPLAAVLTVANNGGSVRATTVRRGSEASVGIGPGTSAAWVAALGFPVAGAKGSGNVGDVDAVTTDEIVGLVRTASKMLYASNPPPLVDGVANPDTNHVRLAGSIFGTDSEVEIYATSTPALLTALGLAVGVTNGTGDAANAAATTAAELFAVWDADLSGPDVALVGTKVTLEGTKGIGSLHYLYLVGPLADALNIAGTTFGPGVAEDWGDAAWVGTRAGLALDQAPPDAGHLTWNDVSVLGLWGDRSLNVQQQKRLNREQQVNTLVLIDPNRGPEYHDGRLSLPFASGSPTFVDQYIATRWFAQYVAAVVRTRTSAISDSGNQLGFADESEWASTVISALEDAESVAVASRCLAFVDVTPPTVAKPTGVVIIPKRKLPPALVQVRTAQVTVRAKLGAALHGLLIQITLNT